MTKGGAVFSDDRVYRYFFFRDVQEEGAVFAYFGVNGSTAGETEEDQTTKKWRGFTMRNGGRRYLAVNPFAYVSTDVKKLAEVSDPVGPDNDLWIGRVLAEADILVPCWGSRTKIPLRLQPHLDALKARIFASGKPVLIFGLTASGDPKHPLMLGYDTPLDVWCPL